jgi:hypothetical protein
LAAANFCPSVKTHLRNCAIAFLFAGSSIFSGTRSQVKLEIGYASSSFEFVIDTRKSFGIWVAVAAAAAVIVPVSALTNLPMEFSTLPH